MTKSNHIILTGNEAAATIAHKLNEVCVIYPITPASGMSELVEELSANNKQNIFGTIPVCHEMQSEAGVAGALHGALQTGSLATTFTASQGLLLMAPNMYKMAGELTPHVIHVATRSLATHALSVFGDHSDIMAVRSTGYAFLGAANVQEAMDFSVIAQAATLGSRIPFVHFFDGFRTSHERSKVETISDEILTKMVNLDDVLVHRQRALNPEQPVLRGSSQGADVFFQQREASNTYYDNCPLITQQAMDKFYELTGRKYQLFDYVGDPNAKHVIISMASSTETIEQTILHLNSKGESLGLIKVRLFRPFSTKHLIEALPKTCEAIAVLDRTKEPGSSGEPLYLDVVNSLMQNLHTNKFNQFPKIVGGRYGLSSKELTPNMINALITNLKMETSKNNFTIGINDDVTHLSLDYSEKIDLIDESYQAIFYESKSDKATTSYQNAIDLIGSNSENYIQGFEECSYDKSRPSSISHFRYSKSPIKASYLIDAADFIGCDNVSYLNDSKLLKRLKFGATLLVNSKLTADSFWKSLSQEIQLSIINKEASLYTVDFEKLKNEYLVKDKKISGLQACFFVLNDSLVHTYMLYKICLHLNKVVTKVHHEQVNEKENLDLEFANSVIGTLMNGKGDQLGVSQMSVDGTFATNTSKYNKTTESEFLPIWDPELCVQCGACSMACPQAAIRMKAFDEASLDDTPQGFNSALSMEEDWQMDLLQMTVQVNPDQCTACNHCVDSCPTNALKFEDRQSNYTNEQSNWNYIETLPELDRSKIDPIKVSQQQFQEPLYKYPQGVNGCGESAYLKLISQLFGDRMLVANATGSSSIVGGALPTTPWSKDQFGRGPAWSNSLFEDNAEFGLGFRMSLDQQELHAKALLNQLYGALDSDLLYAIKNALQDSEEDIFAQRKRIETLKKELKKMDDYLSQSLLAVADSLVKKSVWIVGGDGWAYDIGYGGLDHVLSSGKNVNILVLDNEIYDNTGGQMSKATPYGATTKFATKGKRRQKKDLGLMAMNYEDVYVASVAIGADQEQTLKAIVEAENYDGPSLIIAYCHSESHGIDMTQPSKYHKSAVNSGQWILYRNDPRRAEDRRNSFQLDSPIPTIKIEDYLKMEGRFAQLFEGDASISKENIREIQKKTDGRFDKYLSMTLPRIQNRNNYFSQAEC